jgi:hypothetical protein
MWRESTFSSTEFHFGFEYIQIMSRIEASIPPPPARKAMTAGCNRSVAIPMATVAKIKTSQIARNHLGIIPRAFKLK